MTSSHRFDPLQVFLSANAAARSRVESRTRAARPDNQRSMAYKIWIENARRRDLAVIPGHASATTVAREIGARFAQLYQHLRATPGATTGRNVVVYHDETTTFQLERGIPIEVGVECLLPPDSSNGIRASSTPEGLVATTEHLGPYDRLSDAHSAVRTWCKANGWGIVGTNWEVYGHWSEDPEQQRTAVYYLVR
jgi:effector-binding domain-containing protein